MLFFALKGSTGLGRRIAAAGGFGLALHEEHDFGGGEHKARPLVRVRGRDVYILHGLQPDARWSVNDRLMRLLFFIATCRDHGAARITVIAPYLAYSRKDRRTKPRDPVTTRYVATLFEAVGVNRMVTLDVHNPAAFENAFRCPTTHLSMCDLFARDIAERATDAPLVVASPDAGGVKRAQILRLGLEARAGRAVSFGLMEKRRSGGHVSGALFAGDVAGRSVYLVDDMIVGGATMLRAARAVRDHGAREVHAVATHALMTGEALGTLLYGRFIDSVTVSDSTSPFAPGVAARAPRFRVLESGPLIAAAVRALHDESDMGAVHRAALRRTAEPA